MTWMATVYESDQIDGLLLKVVFDPNGTWTARCLLKVGFGHYALVRASYDKRGFLSATDAQVHAEGHVVTLRHWRAAWAFVHHLAGLAHQ